jgi:outer membrane protein assembly factor BamB
LSAPTIALGKVFVSLKQGRKVVALDQTTGKVAWTHCLGTPVDAPPTIYKGLALVGGRDGWVYALRADDGRLVWRRRAAPAERRIVSFGDLESTWPIVGGVLVVKDTAYAIAGRHTDVDGGLYISAFDPMTGKSAWPKVARHYLDNPGDISVLREKGIVRYDPKLGKADAYIGAADLLLSDGKRVGIGANNRKGAFDCRTGKPDGGVKTPQFGWVPNAPLVARRSTASYQPSAFKLGKRMVTFMGHQSTRVIARFPGWKLPTRAKVPQASCLAGDTLVVGLTDNAPADSAGEVWLIDSAKGKKLASLRLPSAPVFDGLAVAGNPGCVYVVMQNGAVARLTAR